MTLRAILALPQRARLARIAAALVVVGTVACAPDPDRFPEMCKAAAYLTAARSTADALMSGKPRGAAGQASAATEEATRLLRAVRVNLDQVRSDDVVWAATWIQIDEARLEIGRAVTLASAQMTDADRAAATEHLRRADEYIGRLRARLPEACLSSHRDTPRTVA